MLSIFVCAFNVLFASEKIETLGTIKGKLGYPADEIPAMVVCAEEVTTKKTSCISTKKDESIFSLSVRPGSYFVFAHLRKARGGFDTVYRAYYDELVTCGIKVGCKSHAPVEVKVLPGQVVSNIEPVDWYNHKP